jgi:hypothetical protein
MVYGRPTSVQYRSEAEALRRKAAALVDDDKLRERYLSLARDYERIAESLEKKEQS